MKAKTDMSLYSVEIQIDERFQERVQIESLRLAALAPLIHQGVEEACELTIVVTDDEVLHELNRRHRDVDAPTDVLAFTDEQHPEPAEGMGGPFVSAPGLPRYLGDVIISFSRAEAQAREAGHALQVELQLLAVHGVLHLLGYDDVAGEQRARMWAVQAEILEALEIKVNLPE
ncbi:MAG: rRNA maturation RNase YbeY [Chloroflexi bacterium]|nr:rRNA maturation RNase YbeY [Chloroflexota bacterium]